MPLKDRLDEDLKSAIRAQDALRRSVLRSLRSEVHNEEIAQQKPLDDDDAIIGVISRQVRQRRESISEFRKGNRDDLVQREESELSVLLEYLPQQLTPEEITDMAREAVSEVGARGPGDKGRVMGKLMPMVRGRADGSVVNEVVTGILEAM
ncbi:MAG: GatB/YqeY domain-containing protein [Chloroflexota bacterium]|nr:GatB/YqeY domain-containing protein [Chloroflexota bacterium]MDE2941643.1 GatB/YqeY domain-containing protein [Chloroflexota bacterium]MDE3267262.1 GatB/YqeY domain-containing protein [Chloroflexota bacterium]